MKKETEIQEKIKKIEDSLYTSQLDPAKDYENDLNYIHNEGFRNGLLWVLRES